MSKPANELSLEWIDRRHVVCRLPADAEVPPWVAAAKGFTSVTRTPDELSIVCAESDVPPDTPIDRADGWVAFRVAGSLEFNLVGILARLTQALAGARISCFAISTFDTDYVLIREADRAAAVEALEAVADVTRLRG